MGSQVTGGLEIPEPCEKTEPNRPNPSTGESFMIPKLKKHLQIYKGRRACDFSFFTFKFGTWKASQALSHHGKLEPTWNLPNKDSTWIFNTVPLVKYFSIIFSSVSSQDLGRTWFEIYEKSRGIAAENSSGRSALDPESHRWLRESLVEVVSKEQSFTKQRVPIFWGKNRPVWARCEILKFCQRKFQLLQDVTKRFPLISFDQNLCPKTPKKKTSQGK